VVVAVLDAEPDGPASTSVADAAPDADVLSFPVTGPADLAIALDDAVDERASVIALPLDGEALAALGDHTVQRSLRAAADAGVMLVATDPGPDVELPDDLLVVLVGEGGVSGGDVEPTRATALVAGTAALVAGQVTPAELGELLENTADGSDHTVNAEAAVELAANLAAGGSAIPPPEDRTGGLSPLLVGLIAFGLAAVTVGGTILLAGRKPRST
jgi:hypothetical protein